MTGLLHPDRLEPGMALPPLDKGAVTSSRVVRWCAAQENWDRIHYDADYCTGKAGLPGPVINGAMKQHVLCQLIEAAFGAAFWLWRLQYKFTGLDLVGQGLTAAGRVAAVGGSDATRTVELDVWITNGTTGAVTTTGRATLLGRRDGRPMLDATDRAGEGLDVPAADADASGVPPAVAAKVGSVMEELRSYSAVEAGRLRLFAEALGEVAPLHFDAAAGMASPFGRVVAMPLFPIHALSLRPGQRDLSTAADAMGREGVCEVGRDSEALFGLAPTGALNGGNRVQVHALAGIGDRISARSRLVDARRRRGSKGGDMLILQTHNDYWTDERVPLLSEQQTTIFRQVGPRN